MITSSLNAILLLPWTCPTVPFTTLHLKCSLICLPTTAYAPTLQEGREYVFGSLPHDSFPNFYWIIKYTLLRIYTEFPSYSALLSINITSLPRRVVEKSKLRLIAYQRKMLWTPQNLSNACPVPDLCSHVTDLEDNRGPSTTPLSEINQTRAESGFRTEHFISGARHSGVATPKRCCLKSQHRWPLNMKRLFNVKSL